MENRKSNLLSNIALYVAMLTALAVFGKKCNAQIQTILWFGDTGNSGKYLDSIDIAIGRLNPDYVIHTGDIQHSVGEWDSLEMNIYRPFKKVTKNFPNKINLTAVQKLFVAEGNHDRMTNLDRPFRYGLPEINSLMGTKNYYSKRFGNVDLFFQNTNDSSFEDNIKYIGEPDGNYKGSRQYNNFVAWTQSSNAKWKGVVGHHPEMLSLQPQYKDQYSKLRWDFGEKGINFTARGHSHVGEVIIDSVNFPHFINGMGTYALNNPSLTPQRRESIWLNYTYPGFVRISEYNDSLMFDYLTFSMKKLFSYTLLHPKSIKVTALIEGMYNPVTNQTKPDTLRALLRAGTYPYQILDSSKTICNEKGQAVFYFPRADFSRDYYLVLKHRNSMETWTSSRVRFNPNHSIEYNFSNNQSKALGDNQVLSGNRFCLYSGDVNQDGSIDLTDMILVQKDSKAFRSGYVVTDLNGDNFVDSSDLAICYSNTRKFIYKIIP